jgi:hypothetical protein
MGVSENHDTMKFANKIVKKMQRKKQKKIIDEVLELFEQNVDQDTMERVMNAYNAGQMTAENAFKALVDGLVLE